MTGAIQDGCVKIIDRNLLTALMWFQINKVSCLRG